MEKKTHKRVILYCALFAILVIVLTVILLPYFQQLSDLEEQYNIQKWIGKMAERLVKSCLCC